MVNKAAFRVEEKVLVTKKDEWGKVNCLSDNSPENPEYRIDAEECDKSAHDIIKAEGCEQNLHDLIKGWSLGDRRSMNVYSDSESRPLVGSPKARHFCESH